jgi:hypothetical protein
MYFGRRLAGQVEVYKELPQAFFSISALAVEKKFCNV